LGLLLSLFCAEKTVTGIAQAGDDIAMAVQAFINSRHVNIDIGVFLLHQGDSLRRCN